LRRPARRDLAIHLCDGIAKTGKKNPDAVHAMANVVKTLDLFRTGR